MRNASREVTDKLSDLKKLTEETVILRRAVIDALGNDLLELADVISGVIGSGGKVMLGGNGGSLALAQHFASELVVRLSARRNRQALPAVTLGINATLSTAASDDFGWEHALARQVEALANRGDMLLLLSTSGNPANLVRAAKAARERGVLTAALLGGSGGKLKSVVDRALIIPHTVAQRIHEEQLYLIHLLTAAVERDLFA